MQGVFDFYRERPARPERPPRPERLFFCIRPGPDDADRIWHGAGRLLCDLPAEGKRIAGERLHVSLHHVGDYARLPAKFVFAARRAAGAVAMPPFEMRFESVRSFGARSPPTRQRAWPLVLLGTGDAVRLLQRMLGAAMEKNGLRAAQAFTPHMTLLYGPARLPPRAIEPIRFPVREFALVHSALGLTRHETIGRWPLNG
jgi:2'-5' RNA ligase